jgi:gamma-glutamyltranspeptidase/glutathione hydrolase
MQPRFSIATQDALRMLGHAGLGEIGTEACKETIGSVQSVAIDLATGDHLGAADLRREGTVIQVGH